MPLQRRRPTRVVGLAGAITLAASLASTPAHAGPMPASGEEVVGHRGYPTAEVTENTLESFDNAVTHGATAVELDVRLTSDRRFVLMHDRRLHRTTTCSGEVRLRTMRWIRTRCRGERASERIPSLPDALTWAAGQDVWLLLDVKKPAHHWTARDLGRMTALVHRRGLDDRVRYLSFVRQHLLQIRRSDPSARLHAIARDADGVAEQRTWADAVHVWARDLTGEMVTSLHQDGVEVFGRAPNGPEDWTRLREVGVDGLIVDLVADYVVWTGSAAG